MIVRSVISVLGYYQPVKDKMSGKAILSESRLGSVQDVTQ